MPRTLWPTVIRLAIASLVVGTILGFIGADPFDFWTGLAESVVSTVEYIFGAGWDGILAAGRYMLAGAAVVLPIWLLSILLKNRKRDSDPE